MFLTSELSAAIVTNTNDYGQNSEKAWNRWVNIDSYDLDQYLGICIYMGICVLPSIEDYWSASFGCKSRLEHVMTMDRFEMIAAHLHVAPQNVDDTVDKLAKVRDLLNHLNDRCTCLWACGPHLSYDEMMVKCKSKFCRSRVRMPSKPIKDGLKIFGLCCSDTGYVWRHHVYSGEPCENWQTLGKTGAAISLVCRPFVNQGRTIYMDNYFTSVKIMRHLHSLGSYVIFCSQAIEIISHKKYRLVLAEALMQSGRPPAVAEAKAEPCAKRLKPNEPKPKQRVQGGLHALERLEKRKCCVECKVVSRTQYGCDVCKRAMHIECFRAWHTE